MPKIATIYALNIVKSVLAWSRVFRRRHLGRRVTAVTCLRWPTVILSAYTQRDLKEVLTLHERIPFLYEPRNLSIPLPWRHNGRDSVSNHQPGSLKIVYSTVYSDADQGKHQCSASLAFVRGIHRGPVISPHQWPVTRKMFPFDDVIMTELADIHQPTELMLELNIFPPATWINPKAALSGVANFTNMV